MGLRLHSTYYGGYETPMTEWRVEVHDNSGSVLPSIFTMGDADGVVWHSGGETDDLFPWVCPSYCTFNMCVENGAHRAFIRALTEGTDDRFTLKVYQNGILTWVGNILHDDVEEEDSNRPNPILSLTAVDGLAKFKTIPYKPAGSAFYSPTWERLTEHLRQVFDKLHTKGLFGSQAIRIVSDLYETQMSTSRDPFHQVVINHRRFWIEKENEILPRDCYWVLTEICKMMKCQLRWNWSITGPQFLFIDLDYRQQGSVENYVYSIDATYTGNYFLRGGALTINENVFTPDKNQRLNPGVRRSRSPIRYVRVTYEHETGRDFLLDTYFDFFGEIGQSFTSIGKAPVPDDVTRMKWQGTIEIIPVWDLGTDTNRYKIIFWFLIKIGDYYYKRELSQNVNPFLVRTYEEPPTWEQTSEEYALIYPNAISQANDDGKRLTLHFEIITQWIPEAVDGEDIDVGLRYDLYDQDNNLTTEAPFTIQIQHEDGQIIIVDQENSKVEFSSITAEVENDVGNSLDYELKIISSDGPNASVDTRMTIQQPASNDRLESANWTTGRHTVDAHYNILAKELAARRANPRRILDGTFYLAPNVDFSKDFRYCDNIYIFLRGQFKTGPMKLEGDFLEVFQPTTMVISATKEENRKDTSGKPTFDGPAPILPPEKKQYETGPLAVIVPDIEIPDLSGLTDIEIWELITPYSNGIQQRITANYENDGWKWDNVNRQIIPDELQRARDWVIIRYNRALLYDND